MKSLKLTLILTLFSIVVKAQDTTTYEEPPSLFEMQVGVVGYSYFNVAAPSFQFNLATPIGRYVAFGVLLNAYTTTKSATRITTSGTTLKYRPKGFRAGCMMRVHFTPKKTHFYSELIATAGKAYSTGITKNPENSRATEFMGGVNAGVNFKTKNNSFLGFYLGLGVGQLNFNEITREEEIARVQVGGTYHFKP